jgi:hypothetical protein
MQLFKKVFKSLFKFVLESAIYIVGRLADLLVWIEFRLIRLTSLYYSYPAKTKGKYNVEYIVKHIYEYKKDID